MNNDPDFYSLFRHYSELLTYLDAFPLLGKGDYEMIRGFQKTITVKRARLPVYAVTCDQTEWVFSALETATIFRKRLMQELGNAQRMDLRVELKEKMLGHWSQDSWNVLFGMLDAANYETATADILKSH